MSYAATTRAQLRTMLQERYTGDVFWTATDANDAINEALRQFNLFTGYWKGTATANTVAGNAFLSVPAALTATTRVYVAGRPLTRTSLIGLFRTRRNWRTQTTTSGSPVPATVREWAPVGLLSIAMWPTDAAGGTTLTFDGVKITPVLTADGQFLDVGNEELGLLLGEMLWILSFKRPSTQELLKKGHQQFLEGCVERNDQLRQSSYFRRVLGMEEQGIKATRAPKTEVEA